MADQFYFESDYIADDYFAYVAEADASLSSSAGISCSGDIASTTGYFIPDYIADDYFVSGVTQEGAATLSAAATISAVAGTVFDVVGTASAAVTLGCSAERTRSTGSSLTSAATVNTSAGTTKQGTITIDSAMTFSTSASALKNHTAILDSQSSISVDATLTASTDITLSNIVNLSLQAAKTTAYDAALSASFGLSADPLYVQLAAAGVTASATIDVDGLITNKRPRPYTLTNTPTINTSNFKFGSGSALIGNDKYATVSASADFQTWQTIEFWWKPGPNNNTQSYSSIVFIQLNEDETEYAHGRIIRNTDDGSDTRHYFQWRTRLGGTNYTYISSNVYNWTDFKHVRIERDSNGLHLWVNGVKDSPTSNNSTNSYPNMDTSITIGKSFSLIPNDTMDGYFDEYRITDTLLTSTSTSSFTPPTEEYQLTAEQQADTILLSHYNTDFSDDVSEYISGAASASTSATLSADVLRVVSVDSTPSVVAALSATPVKNVAPTVNISGAAQFSIDALAINPGDALLENQFNVEITPTITRSTVGSLNSAATLTADGTVQPGFTSNLTVAATLTADVKRIPEYSWAEEFRSLFHFDSNQIDTIEEDNVTWRTTPTYVDSDDYFTFSETQTFGKGIELTKGSSEGALITVDRSSTSGYERHIEAGSDGWCIELFVRIPTDGATNTTNQIIWEYSTDNFYWTLRYTTRINGSVKEVRFDLVYAGTGGGGTAYQTSDWHELDETPTDGYSQYFHIASQEDADKTVAMFVDGVCDDGAQSNASTQDAIGVLKLPAASVYEADGYAFRSVVIDELLVRIGFAYDTDSSFTVRPRPWTPTYLEAWSVIETPFASLEVDFLRVSFGTLDASVTATLEPEYTRIRPFSSTLTTSATLNAQAVKITVVDSSIASVATQTTTAVKTTDVDATLTTAANLSIDAQRIRDNDIAASGVAALTTTADRIRNPGAITPSVSATISCDAVKTTSTAVDIDGVLAFSATARARYVGEIELDTSATFTSSPVKKTGAVVEAQTAATLAATGTNTVDFVVNTSTASTLVADVARILPGTTNMSVKATVSVSVVQLKGTDVLLPTSATIAATATRIQPNDSGLNTATSLTVDGDRVRFGVSSMSAAFDPFYANAFRVVDAEVALSAISVTVTAGDVIAIDPFRTLLIAQETRRFKILEENRDLTVEQETRVLEI